MSRWMAVAFLLTACASEKPDQEPESSPPAVTVASGPIQITVTDKGYEPTPIQVAKGKPVTLVVTRKTENTCATDLTIPEHGINKQLPLGQPVEITFTPTRSGELRYGCSMDHMISGVLQVR